MLQEAQSIKDNTPDALPTLDQHTKTIWSDTNKQQLEPDEQDKNKSPALAADSDKNEHTKAGGESTESIVIVPPYKMIEQGHNSSNSVTSCHPEAVHSKGDISDESIAASKSHVGKGKPIEHYNLW